MKKFDFRLDKVLDYRKLVEEWAKDAYLEARAQTLEAEVVLRGIQAQRESLLRREAKNMADVQAMQVRLGKLDDEERMQKLTLSVLQSHEESTLNEWREKKAEAESINRLRETAFEDWMRDMNRMEQAELDEWAVQRRAA